MEQQEPIETGQAAATLLFVDDEANILSSLKRLFRPSGYRIFTAGSGQEGLEIIEANSVDLVISDMRMPEMNGAEFLEQVRMKSPDTVRILLTGYAEIGATIDAINKGQIYRYVSKPWEDNDIVITIRQALERRALEKEKERLEQLTFRQNDELKELNATLEARVMARTEELRQAMGFLEIANRKLKDNFLISIKIFSNLIELRGGAIVGHSRRVAEHARRLAQQMGVNGGEIQDIVFAALLHDIGKIGLPDHLLNKPFNSLNSEERAEVAQHPAKGQAALMGLENLKQAARFIRSHHERHDGLGFPDGLLAGEIPLGARILAVVNDYDSLLGGMLTAKRFSENDAKAFLLDARGKRYDPHVVDAFIKMMGMEHEAVKTPKEIQVSAANLRPAMVLSRDLFGPDGLLLLSKDHVMDESLIEQIRHFNQTLKQPLNIYVRVQRN